MNEAYIVESVRTAAGRRNGCLSSLHANDLGARSLDAVVERSGIDPAAIEDVIFGCVTQAGEQSLNAGRNCVLASKLPQSVPAVTLDRQCGSSQQAIHFAAQAVLSGTQDVVIAGGVESMSHTPMLSATRVPEGAAVYSDAVVRRFGVSSFSQFDGAELIATKYGFTREMLDAYGLESHRKARSAIEANAFDKEIVPVDILLPDGTSDRHVSDEGVRWDASLEAMAGMKTLTENGVITAATASQIADGSSAILIVSGRGLKEHGLTPIARIHNLTVTAGDPVIMLEEPLFATDRALQRAGLTIDDIDLYEVNEAFAPVPLAWLAHLNADPSKLNVNGGAIALGHPLGATGAKLMTTLVHALRARKKRWGLQTMCEGGGIANVTIVEAL